MKIGIAVKVDVTKLDKKKFFQGKKGTNADLTIFLDTETTSEYGDNGTVTQSVAKGEGKTPIIGNVRVFYKADAPSQEAYQPPAEDLGLPF